MLDAIVTWLHVLAAVVFIGPQVFLVAVAMPALRSIDDVRARQAASRRITRGFGVLGGIALAVLLATGIWNFFEADDDGLMEFERYFFVMQAKLTLVTVVIVLVALHAAVFGRRLQALQDRGAPEEELAVARRWSVLASSLTLLVSLAILLLAALLDSDWSRMGGIR
ncbi:MAG TPA: hypothetical protein VNM91_11620 [Dehalococcoidia bacterium]|nr:hypothetical protein [Dehalococcoidia bacterium]